MIPRVPVLVVLVVSCIAALLPAADRPIRGSVFAIVRPASAEGDPEFQALLLSVCRVEVEARELELREPDADVPDGEEPVASAAKAGAEFALVIAYATGERQATIDLSWYDVAAGAQAASVTLTAALDFTLDVTIASAVVELLDGQADRIAALPRKRAPGTEPAAVPPAEAPASTLPTAEDQPPPVGQVQLGKDVVRLKPLKPLVFTIGAAPLIATFATPDYIAKMYFGFKTSAAWRFPMLGGAGGVGIVSGLQRYYVENILNQGWFTTLPVGVQAQFGTRMPGPFDFLFHLDGGAVVWFLDPDAGIASSGVVPYVQGGVGFLVNVLDNLGIGLDVAFAGYFFANPNFTFLEPGLTLVLKF